MSDVEVFRLLLIFENDLVDVLVMEMFFFSVLHLVCKKIIDIKISTSDKTNRKSITIEVRSGLEYGSLPK